MKRLLLAFAIVLGLVYPAFAASDFYIVKSDTLPYYTAQIISTLTGSAYNITTTAGYDTLGVTITAYMRLATQPVTGTPKINGTAAVITAPTTGYFEYRWTTGNTDTLGVYYIYFKIAIGGATFTVPATGHMRVIVTSP